jgi:hypothetical protein
MEEFLSRTFLYGARLERVCDLLGRVPSSLQAPQAFIIMGALTREAKSPFKKDDGTEKLENNESRLWIANAQCL